MTDIEIAIERVDAAKTEMERAIDGLRRVSNRADLTPAEAKAVNDAHNRARRSVA